MEIYTQRVSNNRLDNLFVVSSIDLYNLFLDMVMMIRGRRSFLLNIFSIVMRSCHLIYSSNYWRRWILREGLDNRNINNNTVLIQVLDSTSISQMEVYYKRLLDQEISIVSDDGDGNGYRFCGRLEDI